MKAKCTQENKTIGSIAIVILNYNNAEDTIECVESIKLIDDLPLVILIVDNGSDDDCIARLQSIEAHNIILLKNGANIGYAAGNNVGITYAVHHGAEYIFILNNDVVVNRNSIQECVNALQRDSSIGIVGPAILDYKTDRIQSTGANINLIKLTASFINHGKKYVPSHTMIECDYVGGACMAFRSSLPGIIGDIPEAYFLFWEESEWCLKAKKYGLKVVSILDTSVFHKGSATINKISGLSNYYMERNRIVFAKRNIPGYLPRIYAIVRLFVRAAVKGFQQRYYWKYIGYYCDGLRGVTRRNY